jgi:hypothetical protein
VAQRLAQARDRASAAGDLPVELRVTFNLAANRYYAGDVRGSLEITDAAVQRSLTTGLTWSPYGMELRVLQVIARYAAGDWDDSARAAKLAGERPPDAMVARLSAAALYVAVGSGEAGAGEHVRQLEGAWHHDGHIALLAGGCTADLLRWQGDATGSRASVERTITWLARVWEPWTIGGIWLRGSRVGWTPA